MRYTDPEIEFASRLGAVLEEMRAQLEPVAVKRVLTFAIERWGIIGAIMGCGPVPAYTPPPPHDDHGMPHLNEA